MQISYHASHEQFCPSDLLRFVSLAEAAGFKGFKSSDHFHPWSERQGHSGFAWAWLGAAMQTTRGPVGTITAPGYRYHPAVIAQAAATLGEMFPGRFWMALGSGEAVNEAITGLPWPDKAERNAKLRECVDIIRALFDGETVTWRGRVEVVEAKLYSLPRQRVPLFGAAVTPKTAEFAGAWADGLLTIGSSIKELRTIVDAFRRGGGEGKPIHVQAALSWARDMATAEHQAVEQWAPASLGGEVAWDLRRPSDFDLASRTVRAKDLHGSIWISHDLGLYVERISEIASIGINTLHLHQVGRNQMEFIDAFGERVLPIV